MEVGPLTPNATVLEELGRRLQTVRRQQGLTQEALAEQAGIGVATLRRIEDGNDARLGSWIRVLRVLGMSASIDGLLPETFRSPLQDAKEQSRRSRGTREGSAGSGAFVWGDERP